jgi:rRNA maturation RNase YbeY
MRSGITQKKTLGTFINQLIYHYSGKESTLQYVFVSDDFLYEMNLKYLQHDTYTDIITFDLSEKKSNYVEAEIYISVDRVKENARNEKVPYLHELLRVICHGALHLSGFNDKTTAQKNTMRLTETEWVNKYLTQ